jgi:hypothetical protein
MKFYPERSRRIFISFGSIKSKCLFADSFVKLTAYKPVKKETEHIPLFKKWKHWYAAVIIFLLILILFFTWFTKYFS